jgi:hypothetical protein
MHSYHCLLDVPQCLEGGFEMLEAPPLYPYYPCPCPCPCPCSMYPSSPTPTPTPDQAPLAGYDTYCRILRFEANEMMRAFSSSL